MILAAYAALLGREPSEQEISHWAGRMTDGMTWPRFLTLMRNAPEFTGSSLGHLAELSGEVELDLVGGDEINGDALRFRAPAGESVILPSLIDNAGQWEPHITRAMRAIVHPGDTVVDAGANSGYFTVLAGALTGPQGTVLALEPSSSAHMWCERNIALNRQRHCTALLVGLWSEEATLQIRVVEHASTAGHLATDPSAALGEGEVAFDVPCTSLDALAGEGRIVPEKLGLVKMVVQGSEPWALRGMRAVASRHRPPIICHVNIGCLQALGAQPHDIATEFDTLGYRMHVLPKDHQRDWFGALAQTADHPELGLRRVTDLDAMMKALSITDDPIDLLALPS